MGNKVYVGNLAWRTDEESLRETFEDVGPVRDVKVITDRETGRSRGFAFVTFEDQRDAEEALTLDGADLDGRKLRVSIAEERSNGDQQRRGANRPGRDRRDRSPRRTDEPAVVTYRRTGCFGK